MTDEPQNFIPESELGNMVIEPDENPKTPEKSNKNLWVIAGIVVGISCLCTVLCLALFATGVGKSIFARASVKSVLDTFMKDIKEEDIDIAYALFSPRAQDQMPLSDLEELARGENYAIFERYERLTIQGLTLSAAVNTNSDLPQGSVANVTGIISYENGLSGSFTAVLEKVNGEWKIFNIHVSTMIEEYQQNDAG